MALQGPTASPNAGRGRGPGSPGASRQAALGQLLLSRASDAKKQLTTTRLAAIWISPLVDQRIKPTDGNFRNHYPCCQGVPVWISFRCKELFGGFYPFVWGIVTAASGHAQDLKRSRLCKVKAWVRSMTYSRKALPLGCQGQSPQSEARREQGNSQDLICGWFAASNS